LLIRELFKKKRATTHHIDLRKEKRFKRKNSLSKKKKEERCLWALKRKVHGAASQEAGGGGGERCLPLGRRKEKGRCSYGLREVLSRHVSLGVGKICKRGKRKTRYDGE